MSWARPNLRVEQAFRLLPELDVLEPLRALMASISRPRPGAEPHRTVGKHVVEPGDLKTMLPRAIEDATRHLSSLYEAAILALESGQRGDSVATVHALLNAGEIEERAGHYSQAQSWYDHALAIAETLVDQRPEIEALRHLGRLRLTQGHFDEGARFLQRSLRLAEAVQDARAAALACRGLGEIALERNQPQAAWTWFMRGLACGGAGAALEASLQLGLSEVALARRHLDAAEEQLQRAFGLAETIQHAKLAALCLDAAGRIEAGRQHHALALARHREALDRLAGECPDTRLEMRVRLNICQLFLDWDRLPDAEDEIRRAEEVAIIHGLRRQLVWLYVLMGQIRARQKDDTGFVFFEKAIELCRGVEPLPHLEARVYFEYSRYHAEFGEPDEARACLERAHEMARAQGDVLDNCGISPLWTETGDAMTP